MRRAKQTAVLFVLALAVLLAVGRGSRPAPRAPDTGRFVKAGDVELFVQETGPKDGPAVVFLHGAAGWSESWREAMTEGASRGFHCVAMDLPPLGFSEHPSDRDYSMPRQADRVLALLDALKLDRVVLVGHSFGGRATVEAALRSPKRIKTLVLVDPALSLAPVPDGQVQPLPVRALLKSRTLRRIFSSLILTNPRFSRRLLTLFVADPSVATPARVALFQRPLSRDGAADAAADWLPTLLTTVGDPKSSDRAAYARLTMPVVLIWGEKDATTPLEQGKDLLTLLPSARLVVIPGVGHLPPLEAPERFDKILFDSL
jgi:pimeloyl-ACP methyl ester carboxylesterase